MPDSGTANPNELTPAPRPLATAAGPVLELVTRRVPAFASVASVAFGLGWVVAA